VTTPRYAIRPVRPEDVPAVVAMVHELALFERAPEQCHLTVEQLHTALFAEHPALFGHVAVATVDTATEAAATIGDTAPGEPFGFALWFLNFSTWEGVHGIYLEDLYVRPEARGTGAGRALLAQLAATCVQRGYRRLDWSVLHWNPARDFYGAIGASARQDWLFYRLEGHPLQLLAKNARQ
jgi:GNAT superfamily N-acetyltransferase